MMMDVNSLFLNNQIEITFIEPYPELLLSLMNDDDKQKYNVLPCKLQDIDLSVFDSLDEKSILFIDSTHVSKLNSDVNIIIFDILPRLKKGVTIHFHDIFYPFEYPKDWIKQGRMWNEAYLLRAFLEFNNSFEIILFSSYVHENFKDFIEKNMPLCKKNYGGNIWLKKVK